MVGAALSQVFFSLGLGMGAMITYGSYLGTRDNLASAGCWVTLLDTAVALLAGLAVLPAVFAFGMNPGEGPGLSFITLPAVFARMPGGMVFGMMFFLLLVIAALTSALSLLEVVVAYLVDEWGIKRRTAAIGSGAIMFAIGVPASLSFGPLANATLFGKTVFGLLDYISVNLLLPTGGILIALFVGWVVWPRAATELTPPGRLQPRWVTAWRWLCAVVAPVVIGWILVKGL
jgi:NSS family neurotransmitter:Na+ symporter